MAQFRYQVCCAWRQALRRRSQRGNITWERLNQIIDRWLPKPKVYYDHPLERIRVNTQGRSRVRNSARTDLCGGCRVTGIPTATHFWQWLRKYVLGGTVTPTMPTG